MKLKFSLKNKEVSMDADVEGIVEKSLEYKSKRPPKKTRYQIRQEEKRKAAERKHKQILLFMCLSIGFVVVCIIIAIVASLLGI